MDKKIENKDRFLFKTVTSIDELKNILSNMRIECDFVGDFVT